LLLFLTSSFNLYICRKPYNTPSCRLCIEPITTGQRGGWNLVLAPVYILHIFLLDSIVTLVSSLQEKMEGLILDNSYYSSLPLA
jgi:hypothetical protein